MNRPSCVVSDDGVAVFVGQGHAVWLMGGMAGEVAVNNIARNDDMVGGMPWTSAVAP